LLTATVADGMTALIIILAMSFGLIVPKMIVDRIYQHQALARSLETNEHGHLRQP
jgi:predicted DCC family thiol-disulfide oxidoreductase YuxK